LFLEKRGHVVAMLPRRIRESAAAAAAAEKSGIEAIIASLAETGNQA
jgi:hypothetical protein